MCTQFHSSFVLILPVFLFEKIGVCVCVCVCFGGGGGLVAKLCLTLETPWTVALQAPLPVGFSRQEYWSGLPFPFFLLPRRKCVFCLPFFAA